MFTPKKGKKMKQEVSPVSVAYDLLDVLQKKEHDKEIKRTASFIKQEGKEKNKSNERERAECEENITRN